YSWKNQSIFGVANRLLRRVGFDDETTAAYANVVDLNFRTVNIVIVACAVILGAVFVWAMARGRSVHNDAGEFAALLIVIVMFTPVRLGPVGPTGILPVEFPANQRIIFPPAVAVPNSSALSLAVQLHGTTRRQNGWPELTTFWMCHVGDPGKQSAPRTPATILGREQ